MAEPESSSHIPIPFPTYDHREDQELAAYAPEVRATPRFSQLLNSVLGSPYLTTADLPSDVDTAYAPSTTMLMGVDDSAAVGYDIDDMETVDGAFASVPRSLTVTRPTSPTPSFRTDTFSIVHWDPDAYSSLLPGNGDRTPRCSMAFMSSGRRTISGYPSYWNGRSNTPVPSPIKPTRSMNIGMSFIPKIWDALREGTPGKRIRRRPGIPSWREAAELDYHSDGSIDYASLDPLDGEEGELIDDEACFIDVRAITGMDIVSHLPLELALHLLTFLDLPSILACLRVSRYVARYCVILTRSLTCSRNWNHLARDNSIWRVLFSLREPDGWRVDLRRAPRGTMYPLLRMPPSMAPAPLELNWYHLYRNRQELERRWSNYSNAGLSADLSDDAPVEKELPRAYEPKVMRISGHSDRCVPFLTQVPCDPAGRGLGALWRNRLLPIAHMSRRAADRCGLFASAACPSTAAPWMSSYQSSVSQTSADSLQRILLRVRLVSHRDWLARSDNQGMELEDGQVPCDVRGPPRKCALPQVRRRLGHPRRQLRRHAHGRPRAQASERLHGQRLERLHRRRLGPIRASPGRSRRGFADHGGRAEGAPRAWRRCARSEDRRAVDRQLVGGVMRAGLDVR